VFPSTFGITDMNKAIPINPKATKVISQIKIPMNTINKKIETTV
jgi:hypothetical protein